ncbi:peptide N-acetyl-beta-D-glucosaminyl asparaginase amidase A-domain-containing protein [Lactarius akahatsu]|uniref:Peptide N-acetyl-beta-D-glucosaminyl asparaginase amidase A-domain-containing protein n=1 Tax=Lactarius akahatsu TaxID=416441 RepID=A0AAD4Q977_9AGAM|nr:peptide N-acetyl-beta-D-glucosaminyl asparaginase amidase A-domain-containing protein [Lactarius akahatsu]
MSQSIPFLQSVLSLLLLLLCANYAFCGPLVNFQVAQPPPFVLDSEALQCTIPILQRTFGSSIGDPEIVQYTPPTGCSTPNVWGGVTLTLTVTSSGTQFPRFAFLLSIMLKVSIPTDSGSEGIVWTYVKDVTRFMPLFSEPGTFILQLDNVIDSGAGLDGGYAVTLEATIFSGSSLFPPAPRADLIIPLTTLANNAGNEASVPPGFSIQVTLPRNAVTAFVELQASSSNDDTFWYWNKPNQFLSYFMSGIAGNGPFREVRVLVDGQVAGVAFPYAFLSTGASNAAWRPITSYGALDMPTYHLDLTPFIPILTNGQPHTITLDVASAEPDHQINQNWFLSGLLQVNLDSSTLPTAGNITLYQADNYALSTVTGYNDSDIHITVNASRIIHIEAEIIAGSGEQTKVVFTQNLEYGNVQKYPISANDNPEQVFQIASGETLSTHNGEIALQDTFTYPLLITMDYPTQTSSVTTAHIDHAYDRVLLPAPFIMGTTIIEHQVADAMELNDSDFGSGGCSNMFYYSDTEGHTYTRQVNASMDAITFDNQGGTLAPKGAS